LRDKRKKVLFTPQFTGDLIQHNNIPCSIMLLLYLIVLLKVVILILK